MAKLTKSNKTAKVAIESAADDTIDATEVVDATEEETSVTEVAPVKEAVVKEDHNRMVRISIFQEINPAPRIGDCDLPRDLNIPVLKVGVHTLPFNVAAVLADKKYGTII